MPKQHSWIKQLFKPRRRTRTRPRLRLESLEDRVTPSAGDLDTTFGTGGITTTAFESSYDKPQTMLVQPDGRVILIGTTQIGSGPRDLALARYWPDGTLDDTFGDNFSIRESGNGHVYRFNTSLPGGTNDRHSEPTGLVVPFPTDTASSRSRSSSLRSRIGSSALVGVSSRWVNPDGTTYDGDGRQLAVGEYVTAERWRSTLGTGRGSATPVTIMGSWRLTTAAP